MLTHFHSLKRALRFYASEEHPCALLELDAIINADKNNDSPALFCIRGRVKQARNKLPEAIADYMKALSTTTGRLNQRNTLRILQNIVECSMRLKDDQRGPLNSLMRKEFGLKANDWFITEMQFSVPQFRPPVRPVVRHPAVPPIVATGRIANIGKFLLDARDLQKIASLVADPQAIGLRRLTTYQNQEGAKVSAGVLNLPSQARINKATLDRTLDRIGRQEGVIGSCIVGCNGIPIASNLPDEYDAELIGIYSLGMYVQSTKINELMSYGNLPAIILLADRGYSIIANCGAAFIISLTEEHDVAKMARIVKEIFSVITEG